MPTIGDRTRHAAAKAVLRCLFAAVLLLTACSRPDTTADDVRTPIAVEYVRGATMAVRARPDDAAPVMTTYQNGEAVSVLSRRGPWAEVRTGDGSGWVHAADLASAAEASQRESDNLTPRFLHPPEPVSQPGAHGEIVLEATVDQNGEVTSVRTTSNTTGSAALEAKNLAALQRARFAPIVQHGERKPFVYEHRVHY